MIGYLLDVAILAQAVILGWIIGHRERRVSAICPECLEEHDLHRVVARHAARAEEAALIDHLDNG